jgi:3-dehydroquinate dehydratase-2
VGRAARRVKAAGTTLRASGAMRWYNIGLTMTAKILILNGPNLNLLGTRQPEIYGRETLADIEGRCRALCAELEFDLDFRQTNGEGELVTWVQDARTERDGLLLNAGAYTHTSVALLDALNACDIPVVEVHLSNIYGREPFRRHSYVSLAADGTICGFGGGGYELGLRALRGLITREVSA